MCLLEPLHGDDHLVSPFDGNPYSAKSSLGAGLSLFHAPVGTRLVLAHLDGCSRDATMAGEMLGSVCGETTDDGHTGDRGSGDCIKSRLNGDAAYT